MEQTFYELTYPKNLLGLVRGLYEVSDLFHVLFSL
jgi:hypothetical protein